jgi:hypothetical protein
MSLRKRRPSITKPYSGALAEPIQVKHHEHTLLGKTKDQAEKANAAEHISAVAQMVQKFDLLFEHFGITRTQNPAEDYSALAVHLACEHVPGLRLVPAGSLRMGRPKIRDPVSLMSLLADVEVIKRRRRIVKTSASDSQALVDLTTSSTFAPRWGKYKGKNGRRVLANWLTEARDPERNPFYSFWRQEGAVGAVAREGLINVFSIMKSK